MNHARSHCSLVDVTGRFAPKWTLRSVLLAATITLGMYMLLPYLESLSAPPELDTSLRAVDTAVLAPPPPPPPRIAEQIAPPPKAPKPKLKQPRKHLQPLAASMNLEMALGEIAGDFSVAFGIEDQDLTEQIKELVFELSELDRAPRPLARLKPIYPSAARLRRVEGVVVVDFIVTAEGQVRDLAVVSSEPGDLFTESAVRAIRRWRFSPGRKNGEAVATRVRQHVNFSMD